MPKGAPKQRIGTSTPVLPKGLVGTNFNWDSSVSDFAWVSESDYYNHHMQKWI